MFTLYRTAKRSVTESVPDRASVHTRNAAFEAVSAPEQNCSTPLLKVERSVSDRFLKRSERKRNLHPWVRVGQAGRPLPPRTLSILGGLTLKLLSLYDHN